MTEIDNESLKNSIIKIFQDAEQGKTVPEISKMTEIDEDIITVILNDLNLKGIIKRSGDIIMSGEDGGAILWGLYSISQKSPKKFTGSLS